jgi:protein CpxP
MSLDKPMKKSLFATLALAALCSSAPCALYALPSGDSPEALVGSLPTPDDVVKMLVTKLSLSDTQASTIAPIIADRQQKIKAILADPAAGRMAQRRKAREVVADSDAKINAILTPDQRQGYAAIEHQTREQLKQRMRQQ